MIKDLWYWNWSKSIDAFNFFLNRNIMKTRSEMFNAGELWLSELKICARMHKFSVMFGDTLGENRSRPLNFRRTPHSTEIFRQYCRNIPWKYCKIAEIFRNLSLILLKYCNNLAMSAQNMTHAIFYKYCQY